MPNVQSRWTLPCQSCSSRYVVSWWSSPFLETSPSWWEWQWPSYSAEFQSTFCLSVGNQNQFGSRNVWVSTSILDLYQKAIWLHHLPYASSISDHFDGVIQKTFLAIPDLDWKSLWNMPQLYLHSIKLTLFVHQIKFEHLNTMTQPILVHFISSLLLEKVTDDLNEA